MKMLKRLIAASLATLSLCACKTDLSEVWDSIDDLDERLTAVEQAVATANTNIETLAQLCNTLSSNIAVSSVTETENGYEITFSDGTKASITNGASPVVAVAYDSATDSWYWTLDGEWLTDEAGNKVKASAKDGANGADGADGKDGADAATPVLAIGASLGSGYVADATYISVDGGKTWTKISGDSAEQFFQSVKTDEEAEKLTVVLSDGTSLEFPYVKDFMFAFAETSLALPYGAQAEVAVSSKGVVTSQIVKPDGWKVTMAESSVTVKSPSVGNEYAEDSGDVAVIAVSKSGFTIISKLPVSILAADIVSEATPETGSVTVAYTPNESISYYRVYNTVVTASSIGNLSEAEIVALVGEDYTEYNKAASVKLDVADSLKVGEQAAVIALAYDQRGNLSAVNKCAFEVAGLKADLEFSERHTNSLKITITPNDYMGSGYYFIWGGLTSVLDAYEGDPEADLDAYITYLAAKPEGTFTTIWNRKAKSYTWKTLEVGAKYSAVCIPVTKKNSKTANGAMTRIDTTTISADELPVPTVSIEVSAGDWLYTQAKYTVNSSAIKLYTIIIQKSEWEAYLAAHTDQTATEIVVSEGGSYTLSEETLEKTVNYHTEAEKDLYLLAVAEDELGRYSELAQISYTTAKYVEGTATVDIQVSDITKSSAHSVSTPSSDAAYFLLKHADDNQWAQVARDEQGGIYEYVCLNGVVCEETDVYDWTNLIEDTDYTIYCIAVDKSGNYGKLCSAKFHTTADEEALTAEYTQYIGNWTMSYTDYLTKTEGSLQVSITKAVAGKSYYVNGLMTDEYVKKYGIANSSILATYSDSKIYFYCNTSVQDAGETAAAAGYDYKFCGLTKGNDSNDPTAFTNSKSGFVGTYADGKITIEDNGYYSSTSQYVLQGFVWLQFQDGTAKGRADSIIPTNISFTKNAGASTSSVRSTSHALTAADKAGAVRMTVLR